MFVSDFVMDWKKLKADVKLTVHLRAKVKVYSRLKGCDLAQKMVL